MSATPDDCIHLTVDIVKEIHAAVLAQFGGSDGIRDEGLLHSAVAAPQATFGGESPFGDLAEVAAAYLFYICRNHPFIDGNKRAAMTAAIVFLRLNGIEPAADSDKWETLLLDVASSRLDRDGTTSRMKALLPRTR
ncbi:MAG: Death-on-curing family protein [Betaproteobacteria bacterium]|jgi:death-on-curing protein|nr:Death-on-curing family protein [Betaproteobacteria bacterium]